MKPLSTSTRREFLHRGVAAGLISGAAKSAAAAETQPAPPFEVKLIDTNCYIGQWPIRHLPLAEDAGKLAEKLKSQNVSEAWVGSLDALLHKDLKRVNEGIRDAWVQHPTLFKPVGAINPTLPRWEDDLKFCLEHGFKVIRLHPNYHGYKLDDRRFVDVVEQAAVNDLAVQIAVVMEDERTQNAMWRVPPVDLSPLQTLWSKNANFREAHVMLLNWQRSGLGKSNLDLLKHTLYFDIAMLEGIMGIESLLMEVPATHIVFGSYAPVFYFESAKLKLQESALEGKNLNAIAHENATRFLQPL